MKPIVTLLAALLLTAGVVICRRPVSNVTGTCADEQAKLWLNMSDMIWHLSLPLTVCELIKLHRTFHLLLQLYLARRRLNIYICTVFWFLMTAPAYCVDFPTRVSNYCWLIGWWPVPVAARSKAWVCCRSPAEIVGSNPTGGMDVYLLWVLCVVR